MAIYDLPGVYIEEIKPTGAPVKPVGTGVIALVGKFPQGPVNTPTRCGNWEQFEQNFGGLIIGSAAYDAYFAFRQKAPCIYVVRVKGDQANVTVNDTSGTPRAKFKAKVDGEWANYNGSTGVQVIVEEGSLTGTNKITIRYTYAEMDSVETYEEVYDNLSPDKSKNKYFAAVINTNSKIVEVEDLDDSSKSLLEEGTYNFTGGSEPAYFGDGNGIDTLERIDEINILITDKDDSATRTAQLDHCDLMGDRITVLNPQQYMTVEEVKQVGDALDDDRGILTYPWVRAYDPVMMATRSFRPAAFYAGVLAALDPYLSPSNHKINSALDLERKLSRADLVSLQESKISPIYWWGNRGIRIRNGINLSSDPNISQISRRRMTDWIQESVEENFGWAVSRPHTPELRSAIRASLTKWFRDLVAAGWIQDFFVKCDEENNPPEVVEAGKLVVRYGVRLWRAADYIIFRSEIGETVVTTVE